MESNQGFDQYQEALPGMEMPKKTTYPQSHD